MCKAALSQFAKKLFAEWAIPEKLLAATAGWWGCSLLGGQFPGPRPQGQPGRPLGAPIRETQGGPRRKEELGSATVEVMLLLRQYHQQLRKFSKANQILLYNTDCNTLHRYVRNGFWRIRLSVVVEDGQFPRLSLSTLLSPCKLKTQGEGSLSTLQTQPLTGIV